MRYFCLLLMALICVVAATDVSAQTLPLDESFQDGALPAGYNIADTEAASRGIVFSATGAELGTVADGDDGRNYIRTDDTAYHTTDFTAYLTIKADPADGAWGTSEQFFFGLGTGGVGQYGVPDRQSTNDSVWLEFNPATGNGAMRWRVATNDEGTLNETAVEAMDYPEGVETFVHRLMLSYDSTAEMMNFGVDYDYAGGDFVADQTAGPLDVSNLADATNGWASGDASSIFFGGDNYTTDPEVPCYAHSLNVVPEPSSMLLAMIGLLGLAGIRRRR